MSGDGTTRACILVVDDEPSIRGLIALHLRGRYDVLEADSGQKALALLDERKVDLVLTDINMPEMMGYELIEQINERHPGVKSAVITGWSIEECTKFAIDQGVGNIITKQVPFDLKGLDTTVNKLVTEDIFGLDKYMEPGTRFASLTFNTTAAVHGARDAVLAGLEARKFLDEDKFSLFQLVLDEAVSNAAYHSEGHEKGTVQILKQQVEIQFGRDSEKVGVSIVDSAGHLTKGTILKRLDSCLHQTDEDLFAESGRGIFLMRSFVDRLIINIKRNHRTEIILILYLSKEERGDRPLLIHEI